MPNLNQTSLSDAVKTKYEDRLLMRAVPRLVHGRWARKATINKRGSYEVRRYESLSAVTSALGESSTPAEQSAPTLTLITMTPAFYGAWIGYGDEIELTIFDPLVSEVSGILGEQAGVSADTLIRNTITAGATKRYSGGQSARTDLDAPDHDIDYEDFVDAYVALIAQNTLPLDGGFYVCIMHPYSYASLMKDATFVNTFQHASPRDGSNPMRTAYMGDFLNCRCYITSNARSYADGGVSTTDVYSMLFIGTESYGTTGIGTFLPSDVDMAGPEGLPLTGKGKAVSPVELIAKQLGSAGADDPLNQRATIGWKLTLATEMLNASFIVDLEHTNAFSDA